MDQAQLLSKVSPWLNLRFGYGRRASDMIPYLESGVTGMLLKACVVAEEQLP